MIDFRETEENHPRVNLSALIDVAFILVIFIVLAASFRQERDIEIELPETDAVQPKNAEGLEVIVRADGSIRVEGREVARAQVRATLEELRGRHTTVMLSIDRAAAAQAAVEVLADAQSAGFESVAIATRERGREG